MILSYPSGASFINTAGTLYIKAARRFVIPVPFLSFVAVFATLSNNVQDCKVYSVISKCIETDAFNVFSYVVGNEPAEVLEVDIRQQQMCKISHNSYK